MLNNLVLNVKESKKEIPTRHGRGQKCVTPGRLKIFMRSYSKCIQTDFPTTSPDVLPDPFQIPET